MPSPFFRRAVLGVAVLLAFAVLGSALLLPWREIASSKAIAAEPQASKGNTKQPESSKRGTARSRKDKNMEVSAESHPLDPALEIARERLQEIEKTLFDYEATLTTRERIGNTLTEPKTMAVRIREEKKDGAKVVTPLSAYLRFMSPGSVKGQEVLWVKDKNNNKLLGHQGGTLGRFTPSVWLDPKGPIAMRGSRYPITEIGITNLVNKLIEKGERDRKYGEVEVRFDEKATVAGRPATLIEVKHPTPRPYFDFHIAQIYIDKELNLPVRYAAYSWPKPGSNEPELLEEYTYTNVKPNVGLTDKDFDPHNKSYGFH